MLFISDETDRLNTIQYINTYTEGLGIKDVKIDLNTIKTIILEAKADGHYAMGGANGAGVFRKVASFISYFIALRPITDTFPLEKIGAALFRINNHQNVIVALAIALDSLHDAKIYRADGEYTLVNPITISKHSYIDIIGALSDVTPSNGMKLVAVLLEQMAYKKNPHCEYP